MVVFGVNPWEKQREIKHRRELARFHNVAGISFLEAGHFRLAKKEFEATLRLKPTDALGLNGRYLSELFLAMSSPDWDISAALAVQDHLLNAVKHGLLHVAQKYLGDLSYCIERFSDAAQSYEAALTAKGDYPDALNAAGWIYYAALPDVRRMQEYFRVFTKVRPYDYRGFHGLGYALYMQAVGEPAPELRTRLLVEATQQSEMARKLGVNKWSVMADFGEVARSLAPNVSVYFHERAGKLLDDPIFAKVNPRTLSVTLLLGRGTVSITSQDEKRAWIAYQLALDYLAMYRSHLLDNGTMRHDELLDKARLLDVKGNLYGIYADQLAILDSFCPPPGTGSARGPSLPSLAEGRNPQVETP